MNDIVNVDGTDLVPTPLAGTVGTDFMTFAVGSGANIEAQADYAADPLRATGNLPGLARSNFNNKAIRQGTFVAHSLSLWISQQLVQYVPDDGNDIAWIGEFTSALSAFMLALIPPGPNLGAYLPLAGGTMSGNIQFQSGVSTVLANNTWYYGKDTVGTNRGLIIKSNDNNVYINDGSSVYVYFNGIPTTNNNYSWSGKDTGGTTRAVIGLLSDNAVHVGSGSVGNIYLDTTAVGGVYFAGASLYTNNSFISWRDTGGTYRNSIGMNTSNALLIGSGVTGTTDIYAGGGQAINLHNNTVALGALTINGYTYLQGGSRAYIPGGNDPFTVYSDSGFYARIHFTVGGVRDWTVGCTNAGWWTLTDETAHAVRWETDLSGHVHAYNNFYIAGLATVGGTFSAGGFASFSGGVQVNNGLTVYNGLNVASGNLTVSGGTFAYNGLTAYNGLSVQSGGLGVNGAATLNNGLTVYNNFYMASGSGAFNGPLQGNSTFALYGAATFYGTSYVGGVATCNNDLYVNGWIYPAQNIIPTGNGTGYCGACQHQWWSVYSFNFANESDISFKQDIAPLPAICLDLVNALQPKTFKWKSPPELDDHGEVISPEHGMRGTHWGFIYQDVAKVMHDPDRPGPDFAGAYEDMGTGNLMYNELTAVLWQAVRELSAKVAKLESAAA